MIRRPELEGLMHEIGLDNLNELVAACGQISMLLNELPPAERARFHARLTEVLEETDSTHSFVGRFFAEVISKGLALPDSNEQSAGLSNTLH